MQKPCQNCGEYHPVYVTCKDHARSKKHATNDNAKGMPSFAGVAADAKSVPHAIVVPESTSKNHASFKAKEKEHTDRWRSKNRAKYNAYMREYRRRKRMQE